MGKLIERVKEAKKKLVGTLGGAWLRLADLFRCRTCTKRHAVEELRQGAVVKVRADLVRRGTTTASGPMYLWFSKDGDPVICDGTPPPAHRRPAVLRGVDLVLDVGRVEGTVRRA